MILRTVALLIALNLCCLSASAKPDWSVGMVESTMKRYPTAKDLGSWGYAKSLYLYGQYLVYLRTRDPRYLKYIKDWVDYHVDDQGVVRSTRITGTKPPARACTPTSLRWPSTAGT